jgi:hypothetical protein
MELGEYLYRGRGDRESWLYPETVAIISMLTRYRFSILAVGTKCRLSVRLQWISAQ